MTIEIELAFLMLEDLDDGAEFSRDTLKNCYEKLLSQHGSLQEEEVTDMWVNILWKGFQKVGPQRLASASSSKEDMAKALSKVMPR
ncbi:hypothetical protein [Vibrio cholerae]|uniref:hypothetical protein n=1 Tax=Vibrio cholerae TaxID=666 RepID=UPI000E0BFD31|nr:hypothetical protein [Vibrio cholerae]EJY0883563.1 hypothetical protein [Vibrio cholerae]